MRPLNVVSHAISDRLEHWLSRKQRLYVTFHPQPRFWSLAWQGEEQGMELVFMADFTHDDPHRTLLLTGAYISGTTPWQSFFEPIEIRPKELVTPQYEFPVLVHPVVGKIGETWKGRLIFVDQFKRPYKTDKIELKFIGPKEHPLKVKADAGSGRPTLPSSRVGAGTSHFENIGRRKMVCRKSEKYGKQLGIQRDEERKPRVRTDQGARSERR